jgi:hypothetical protein
MLNNKNYSLPDVKTLAPSVFTTSKAEHLTNKYIQTPTSRVVEDLMNMGWIVTDAKEIKARRRIGFQKHMVVLRNPNIVIKGEAGDDSFPQILLTNSHDGKNAFNFRVGIFRLVCSNGLVVCSQEFNNISIRHINYTFETLQTNINEIISKLPGLIEKINTFKSIQLTAEQIVDFVHKAAELRKQTLVDIREILTPKRTQDEGNDLWVVFNKIQEKIINGGYVYGNKDRQARSIKNFQQNIKINEQLFVLAESYVG